MSLLKLCRLSTATPAYSHVPKANPSTDLLNQRQVDSANTVSSKIMVMTRTSGRACVSLIRKEHCGRNDDEELWRANRMMSRKRPPGSRCSVRHATHAQMDRIQRNHRSCKCGATTLRSVRDRRTTPERPEQATTPHSPKERHQSSRKDDLRLCAHRVHIRSHIHTVVRCTA